MQQAESLGLGGFGRPAGIAGEWIAAATEADLGREAFAVHIDGQRIHLVRDAAGHVGAAFAVPDGEMTPICVRQAYGIVWLCLGAPKRPLFSLPEYGAPGGAISHCGIFGVRTSPLRAVENFLDMGHFPYVHAEILGEVPNTEVKPYRVELRDHDELWALDCVFHQPKSAPGADSAQETLYAYRVVSPFNVILYKSPPAGYSGMDAICLFVQPLAEDRVRAHLMMVLRDQTSSLASMIAFQQLIFSQDKPILENHVPLLLPLTGPSEKPVRADAMSMAYRKWLLDKEWTYGVHRPN